jgi:hypothetical protein
MVHTSQLTNFGGRKLALFETYLCTGLRQDFLPRVLVDTKWIYIVRSMARPCTVNGQTVEDRHQKKKV